MTDVLPEKYCPCGRLIQKDQFGAESADAFAKRYAQGVCRSKCARVYKQTHFPRPRPTLALISANYQRPEMVTQEKVATPRDEKYKAFIRGQRCALNGGRFGLCEGDVIPHHTETGGMSIKGSDYSCVPLCCAHHKVMDNAGKKGRGIWTERELKAILHRLQRDYQLQTGRVVGGDKRLTKSGGRK